MRAGGGAPVAHTAVQGVSTADCIPLQGLVIGTKSSGFLNRYKSLQALIVCCAHPL